MRRERLKEEAKAKDIEDERENKKERQKVESSSYVESECKEGLLQHAERDGLKQDGEKIFVTAGVKCIVLFEAQPFQNMTLK